MTPLETQLLRALQLRRATSFPFTPAPVGLGLPYTDEHTSSSAWARRNITADAAVEAAIAAGEAQEEADTAGEAGWRDHGGGECPVALSTKVDIRLTGGKECGGRRADWWEWSLQGGAITHWRYAV